MPSLDEITERLNVSEDVAGATLMAAGGSAPELFTSFIGTFIAKSDVGLGTIVGSAVFNVLFVIAMCALFSKEVLTLTWWPLARDCSFYAAYLGLLTAFFVDKKIEWWEALLLFIGYLVYVGFMTKNKEAEQKVREMFNLPVTKEEEEQRKRRDTILAGGALSFHMGALAVLMSSVDPKGMGANKKENRFKRGAQMIILKNRQKGSLMAKLKAKREADRAAGKEPKVPKPEFEEGNESDSSVSEVAERAAVNVVKQYEEEEAGNDAKPAKANSKNSLDVHDASEDSNTELHGSRKPSSSAIEPVHAGDEEQGGDAGDEADAAADDDDEEIDPFVFPESTMARVVYILLFPLTFALRMTLPTGDQMKEYFVLAFFGSIVWIGIMSYLMVWWATVIGDVAGIPPAVMGLTFLAAGTSVPDLITSVLVARKGLGDMAVSSSIGSNLFDICVGLPLPWFFYTTINGHAISVGGDAMFISVVLLLMMLVAVISTIALSNWRMTKTLGIVMLVLYGLFVLQNLLFEYDIIEL